MNKLKLIVVVLTALVIWLGVALVHVENERYALQTGLCKYDAASLQMFDCLKSANTRLGWWWHLYYALLP